MEKITGIHQALFINAEKQIEQYIRNNGYDPKCVKSASGFDAEEGVRYEFTTGKGEPFIIELLWSFEDEERLVFHAEVGVAKLVGDEAGEFFHELLKTAHYIPSPVKIAMANSDEICVVFTLDVTRTLISEIALLLKKLSLTAKILNERLSVFEKPSSEIEELPLASV